MPTYDVEDNRGHKLSIEGDGGPPTEAELEDIFSKAYPEPTLQPSIPEPGQRTTVRGAVTNPLTQAFPVQQAKEAAAKSVPQMTAEEIEQQGFEPRINLGRTYPEGTVKRAAENILKGIPEFISSPLGILTPAIQATPAGPAMDVLFGAGMVKSGSQKLGEASVTGDHQTLAEGIGELILGSIAGTGPALKEPLADLRAATTVGRPDITAADLAARQALRIRDSAGEIAPGLTQQAALLPKSAAEVTKPTEERIPNASENAPTTEVHGDVRSQPQDGVGQVLVDEGGQGVQPQAQGGIQEETVTPGVSVPLMVTKEMEQALADLGYDKAARNKLTPQEAQDILAKQIRPTTPAGEGGEASPASPAPAPPAPVEAGGAAPAAAGGVSVGPGAASPEDVSEPGTIVSNMFAAIDRDRAARGQPPMPKAEPRTWDQDRDTAEARMNRDPQWIPDLIKEVAKNPRPLQSWEQAGMVIQKAYWKAEANNALRRIANAVDSNLAEDELVRAKADAARFEDNIKEMEDAVGMGGTGSEAGRTLQAQKMGLTDDLDLVEMRLEARGKLGGRPLTEAESARIAKIHEEYQAKVAALEKATADADKRRIDAETRAALSELARQSAEAKVPKPHIQRLLEKVGNVIHTRANAARERLRGKLFTLSPDVLKDLAEVGADNIWTIGEDFTRWSAKMIEDIGEKVRPHLQAVWEASKKMVEETFDVHAGKKSKKRAAAKDVDLAKQTIKKGDTPQQQRAKLTARIVDRFSKKQLDRITPAVQKLARTFVEEGVTGRDELIDAVHGVLSEILPDWDRRDTMDAISGYGDYKSLTKDEVSVKLRDLKGQMQQIAKLEDMAGGQAPLRTGIERREVTRAQQELIRLVNEAKRKGGYETTDPTKQLRTALDEVKKRTQTAIDDYEKRIAEKDYAVRKTTPIKPDAELVAKQAELKRVRKEWEQQKRDWEMANRSRWQRALDRFVRWERAFKLSSPVVFGKLAAAAITRVAETAATETLGKGLRAIPGIRTVAKQAPREGAGLNVGAFARAMKTALTKGMKDAAQTRKTGASDIDMQYGEKLIDKDWVNTFGRWHGMMKAPVKRFEIEYSLEQRIKQFIETTGHAPDELSVNSIMAQAVNDGYRSIFMQRGFSSDMFNQFVGQLEKSKKYPVAGEVSARVLRFLMPVVRVPANIVAETATGVYGAPMASARTMFHAINGTLHKLDPVVADSIMRQFKKGSIGLGLMAIGYFNPESVGGYDWREKRPEGGVKTAGFQIGGTDIPRWMTHAPWFELVQMGATIRHVKDQHVGKTGDTKGMGEGLWAAGLGLIEETPFIGTMVRVDKLFGTPAERTAYLGQMAKSTLVPEAISKIADLTDDGSTRKPTTIMENVKMGIPGMRSDVPVKTTKGRGRQSARP